jgi:RNA polymerase-binding transcription factor
MIQPKSPLDGLQLHRFRDRLLEERRRLQESLSRLYGEAVQNNPENLGDTTARTHLADLGSETFEQSQNLGLAEQASRTITETDRALERIEQGTYGICESRGRPISTDRLEAIPSASRCAACQSTFEQGLDRS